MWICAGDSSLGGSILPLFGTNLSSRSDAFYDARGSTFISVFSE